MLIIDLVGDRDLLAKLDAVPWTLRSGVARTMTRLAVETVLLVKQKLSGQVLRVRSGALRASIRPQVTESMTAVTATISSTGVRYAAIHEFGGTIHIPEIRPKTARALAFEIGGQTIFAAYTRAHDVHMPQRSFLASALREMTPRIREELNRAVSEVVR
jgi:phage gpG-like protein